MSRKWERMVEKNRKKLNEQRAKYGKEKVKPAKQTSEITFQGRNIIVSLLCLSVSVIFLLFFEESSTSDTMYWIVIVSYFLLALYFYFLKRPYIKISKHKPFIAIRKIGKEKVLEAEMIEYVQVQPGIVAIKLTDKRSPLMITRLFNLVSIKEIAPQLQQFASKHGIEFKLD